MNAAQNPMVVAGARALCAHESEECNVDSRDNWAIYGDDFLARARVVLDESGALAALTQLTFMARTTGNPTPELIAACEGAEKLISGGSSHG
jgi:hypothetical protein